MQHHGSGCDDAEDALVFAFFAAGEGNMKSSTTLAASREAGNACDALRLSDEPEELAAEEEEEEEDDEAALSSLVSIAAASLSCALRSLGGTGDCTARTIIAMISSSVIGGRSASRHRDDLMPIGLTRF